MNREAIGRALWNLLDNAVKYSPEDAPVRVDLERSDDAVAIHARDEGPGIPAAEQKQIFKKFVRGAAARGSHIKGTGIGLAMVQHIVRAHGGEVRVESQPGKGSTFSLVLPASRDRGSGIGDQGLAQTNRSTTQPSPSDPRSPHGRGTACCATTGE